MSQANEPVVASTAVAAETKAETAKPAAKAKKAATRKPASRAAQKAATKKANVYFQNAEGRVFIGDEFLIKQFKKRKFGLARITAAVYEEAMENGGLTDPIDSDLDDEEEEL